MKYLTVWPSSIMSGNPSFQGYGVKWQSARVPHTGHETPKWAFGDLTHDEDPRSDLGRVLAEDVLTTLWPPSGYVNMNVAL